MKTLNLKPIQHRAAPKPGAMLCIACRSRSAFVGMVGMVSMVSSLWHSITGAMQVKRFR